MCGVLIEGVDGGLIADQAARRAEPSRAEHNKPW
jgi:hypothetical protein